MPIASAIIAGVVGVGTAVAGAAGASSSAKAAEEAEAKRLKAEEEEAEKNRKLKERQQRQQGFGLLAEQRQAAQGLGRQRSFSRDVNNALKNVSSGNLGTTTTRQMPAPQVSPLSVQAGRAA